MEGEWVTKIVGTTLASCSRIINILHLISTIP